MEQKFLEVVAETMEVEVDEISMETEYMVFSAWDSLMFMNMLMDLEDEFEVSIPIEKIGSVKKLRDLYELIEQ